MTPATTPHAAVLSRDAAGLTSAPVVAVGITAGSAMRSTWDHLGPELAGLVATMIADGRAGTDVGTVTPIHRAPSAEIAAHTVLLVGLGEHDAVDDDVVRTAASAAVRLAPAGTAIVSWPFDAGLPIPALHQVRALVDGALLGGHRSRAWTSDRNPVVAAPELAIVGIPADLLDRAAVVAKRTAVVARWTNRARHLVDQPANLLTPEALAAQTRQLLAGSGVEVEVLDAGQVAELGMGGLVAVGSSSRLNPPVLIVMRWRPDGSDSSRRLGLIGKGVTFDAGSLFLKPQSDIVRQKADMGGAAAVIGTMGAVAELGLTRDIIAVVPAAENMPGSGLRPSDVVTLANGLTVEVNNPDAEGRLIIGDALWYAAREGAAELIDVATLTGAMRAAFGDVYAGVLGNDPQLRDAIVADSSESGDAMWPWPSHRRFTALLRSSVADVTNTARRPFGYALAAAAFIELSVPVGVPWAHIDIHSVALLDEPRDYLQAGASGFGVRALTDVIEASLAR